MSIDYAALKQGGFMRQKQKDKFSLRLRVTGGHLTAQQLQTAARIAETWGKGYVHMTSRQSVEIPFIDLKDVETVKKELAQGGLMPGACGPRVRTVTACQGDTLCSGGCIDAYGIAKALEERYFGRELPHKFKFGVTGCANNCVKAEENDVGIKGGMEVSLIPENCTMCGVCIKACRRNAITSEAGQLVLDREECNYCGRCVKSCPFDAWTGKIGYVVYLGGLFGNHIHTGVQLSPLIRERETLLKMADAAIDFFQEHGKSGERFYFTLQRVGVGQLAEQLNRIAEEEQHD